MPNRRSEPPSPSPVIGPVEVLVFLVELVLLAVFAVAGARLGGGALSVILAIALPLAAAALWAVSLAPKARSRLPFPPRLVVKLVLALFAAVLLAASGKPVPAFIFVAFSWPLFTAGELRERRFAGRD